MEGDFTATSHSPNESIYILSNLWTFGQIAFHKGIIAKDSGALPAYVSSVFAKRTVGLQ
jgi:hypothetical protein